jgi:ribonuclease VapC
MIVDTSALMAVVLRQPGHDMVIAKLAAPSAVAGIGTPTVAELGIVLSARLRIDARSHVTDLLDRLDITEVPFGEAHWREAIDAYGRFGRGRHPAALNYGDCLTYAVARLANEPLLYVGDDFAATDLEAA